MAAPKPDLATLFGGSAGGGGAPGGGLGGMGDEAGEDPSQEGSPEDKSEDEQALDAAIDEMFSATDPEQRREAFKTACKLCAEQDQEGNY